MEIVVLNCRRLQVHAKSIPIHIKSSFLHSPPSLVPRSQATYRHEALSIKMFLPLLIMMVAIIMTLIMISRTTSIIIMTTTMDTIMLMIMK